jgi:heat shock protein HslJ
VKIANAVMWMCALGLGACAVAPEERASAPPAPEPRAAALPRAGASPASLVGTRWTGVVEGADPRTLPRLEFATEGRIVGFTGCNMLSGAYSVVGGEVKFGPMVTTKRGCVGREGDVERRVLAVLGENARVTREGNKLILTGPGGARFEFVEAAAS